MRACVCACARSCVSVYVCACVCVCVCVCDCVCVLEVIVLCVSRLQCALCCVYISLTLLFLYCTLRSHVRRKHLTNTLVHRITTSVYLSDGYGRRTTVADGGDVAGWG